MKAPRNLAQVAALPVRVISRAPHVLLVTSRDTGRWIIPKGWPMKGKTDHAAAAQEAYEEAGVRGKIHSRPLGAFVYDKQFDDITATVRVMVYLLEVKTVLGKWPEIGQRSRKWVSIQEATDRLAEPNLKRLVSRFRAPIA